MESSGSSSFVEISTAAAILFVVVASCFLVMIYKLMSYWFIEILVVVFCIGGAEVSHSFSIFGPSLLELSSFSILVYK